MANANDSAPWTNLRLEELIRILDVQAIDSCERKKTFRQKLESLKERQEELQQRRVSRLSEEGIHIDLDLVKRHAKEPKMSNWLNTETENADRMNALNDKLRELFQARDTKVEEDANFVYESENEDVVEPQQNKQTLNKRSLVKIPSRDLEPTKVYEINGEDNQQETFDNDEPSTDKVKTVEVRVIKHGTKRSVKTIGQVVSATKYLSKVSNKNNRSINRPKVEEYKRKSSFMKKK